MEDIFVCFSLSLFALKLAVGHTKKLSSKVISLRVDSSGSASDPHFSVVVPGKDIFSGFSSHPKVISKRSLWGVAKFLQCRSVLPDLQDISVCFSLSLFNQS